jgi:hypothetical protein
MALALLLLAAASLTQAHFGIEYPPMRANTLGSNRNTSYSQWTNPCRAPSPLPFLFPNTNNTILLIQAPAYQAT